jgi:hypothetical protein
MPKLQGYSEPSSIAKAGVSALAGLVTTAAAPGTTIYTPLSTGGTWDEVTLDVWATGAARRIVTVRILYVNPSGTAIQTRDFIDQVSAQSGYRRMLSGFRIRTTGAGEVINIWSDVANECLYNLTTTQVRQ